MTNTLAVIRFIRKGIVASLLGAALLIGSARAGSAAELAPIPVSAPAFAPVPQAQDAGHATPAAARPVQPALPSVGAVGFGWG